MSEPSTYPEFHSAELFRTDRVGRTLQVLYCPGTPLSHIKELRMHDCVTHIDIKVYQGYLKESNINCMITMCIDFQAVLAEKGRPTNTINDTHVTRLTRFFFLFGRTWYENNTSEHAKDNHIHLIKTKCNIIHSTCILIYSKSMKKQHLFIRYLSDMDLPIKISFSSDNCTLHQQFILCVHWLSICIVYKYLLENTLSDSVLCSEWMIFIFNRALLADLVHNIFPTSKFRYLFSISKHCTSTWIELNSSGRTMFWDVRPHGNEFIIILFSTNYGKQRHTCTFSEHAFLLKNPFNKFHTHISSIRTKEGN